MGDRETVLWLIRHPQPAAFAHGRCYGGLDVPLSAEGERQAHSIAAAFAAEPLAAIHTSPLLRCAETAHIIGCARQCRVEAVDALREMNFVEFEGRSYEEIAALYPDLGTNVAAQVTATIPAVDGATYRNTVSRRRAVYGNGRPCPGRRARFACATQWGRGRFCDSWRPDPYLDRGCIGDAGGNLFRIAQRYGAINRIRYSGAAAIVELING